MNTVCIEESSYHNVDGILFDKDGTLLDFRSLWIDWSKYIIQSVCFSANLNSGEEACLSNALGVDWDTGDWDIEGPLAIGSTQDLVIILTHQLYKSGISWHKSFEIVASSFMEVNNKWDWTKHVKPISGLIDFLKNCRKFRLKLGVITSDDYDNAIQHLKAIKIIDYFETVIGGDQVSHEKPFPEAAEKACSKMNLNSQNTIVFGDTDSDMVLGKHIKAQANIGVIQTRNNIKRLPHADHMIHTYEELHLKSGSFG